MEAAIGDDNTWYEFLPILGWIIADAAVARGTLEQAVQQLDRAAAEANRLAAIAHGAPTRRSCLLRRDVYVALDLDRVRVADLLREEPAAAEPGPVAVLRPNYGLLVNVSHGIDLLLRTEPTEQAMQAFSLRWEEDRDIWYPGWLASVKMEVGNALRSLALASLQARVFAGSAPSARRSDVIGARWSCHRCRRMCRDRREVRHGCSSRPSGFREYGRAPGQPARPA
ncbi:hypothetical protein ZWY2020_015585 [Hordeum vulgare]|nr:hypothetical protein ZWY2020_015585 [Hordeum vulgare]